MGLSTSHRLQLSPNFLEIMENLKIQYSQNLPEIDFAEFVNQDNFGWSTQHFIDGAKGTFKNKHFSQVDFYECLWKMAMEFVEKQIPNWNGVTQCWYVDEFIKAVGVPMWKNWKIVEP